MTVAVDTRARLSRMEEARRQTQRQLEKIERQIRHEMASLMPQLQPKQTGYRNRKTTDQRAFLERYRLYLAALTAEQQPEIDALCSRLSLQDHAISAIRALPCSDLPPAA